MSLQTVRIGGKVTGQHRMTSLSTAVPIAGVGNRVILQPETQSVRIRFGGTPTTTVGILLTAGTIYEFELGPEQAIHDIQVIEVTASAVLNVLAVSTK